MKKLCCSTGFLTIILLAVQAHAATFVVNNTNDSASGSLRQAIEDANSNAGPDIIEFTIAGTITLTSGQLTITDDLVINGPGATNLTVSGNNASRVFQIDNGVVSEINRLTITEGFAFSEDFIEEGAGGGIVNFGILTLNDCSVTENYAEIEGAEDTGGGIFSSGELYINRSLVSENLTFGNCGAIYNIGVAAVTSSTIDRNDARGVGGICNATEATMTIRESSVSFNSSTDTSGGITNRGDLWIFRSTISHNSGESTGGIVSSDLLLLAGSTVSNNNAYEASGGLGISGTAVLVNSTISDNYTGWGTGGITNQGSLWLFNTTVTRNTGSEYVGGIGNNRFLNIANTIIAGNFEAYPSSGVPDISGTFTSLGYNLIGDRTGSVGTPGAGDLIGTSSSPIDPMLGPLEDNGGPTLTHLPLSGSPVIDAGSNALIPAGVETDQRGFLRIVDGSVDMGSVEFGDGIFIAIDVKPDEQSNSVNPGSKQKIPVAVLTSDVFDALSVDPDSVRFGPGGATKIHKHAHAQDVDEDGDMDLLFHFGAGDTGIVCGDSSATLTGQTLLGQAISGTDSVRTVPCR